MPDRLTRIKAQWNETANSDWYMGYRTDAVIEAILADPSTAFHRATWALIVSKFPTLNGVNILVPSSGDNRAVFAFAALGANVVSCDISDVQLEHAARVARKYALNVEFRLQDTMKLNDISGEAYDFVYTSEGVHVWIDDLRAMYKNIHRVLKRGGAYINYEIHPFTRPFAYDDGRPKGKTIAIQKPYEMTGPFDDGATYHWRMQDILNAICDSGLVVKRLEEMHDEPDKGHFWFYETARAGMSQAEIDEYYDYKQNPLAALPQWFSVCAVREGA